MRNEVSYGAISSVQKCNNVPVTYQQKAQCTALFRETLSLLPGLLITCRGQMLLREHKYVKNII